MKTAYDVIVVGAGPAGSMAALYAAQKGISVLLLEKDRDVGYPVRCGEAVSKKGLEEFLAPEPKFIATEFHKFRFIAPNEQYAEIAFPETGYVLERRVFDYELARMAADAGTDVLTRAYVNGLIIEDDKVAGVTFEHRGEVKSVRAKVVIAADGVESRVARWAGLRTHSHFRDMESAVQVTAANIPINQDTLYFYMGQGYAPNGYLWLFPKGNNKVNIGLGISGEINRKKSALSYLNDFIDKYYPGAPILSSIAGGVPCEITLKNISGNGIMLVGDAARQINPLSGGGILSGMIGGKIAGAIAGDAILQNKLDHIRTYDKAWHDRIGKRHEIFNKIKEGIYNFPDKTFNDLALVVNKVPMDQRTLGRLFTTALMNQPSLLIDVAKVFVI